MNEKLVQQNQHRIAEGASEEQVDLLLVSFRYYNEKPFIDLQKSGSKQWIESKVYSRLD